MLIFRDVQTNTSELYMWKKLILSSGISETTRTSPPQQNSLIRWWFNDRVEKISVEFASFPSNVESKLVGGFNPSEKY